MFTHMMPQEVVERIKTVHVLWKNGGRGINCVIGFKFLDREPKVIFNIGKTSGIGFDFVFYEAETIILKEGEVIVGVVANLINKE